MYFGFATLAVSLIFAQEPTSLSEVIASQTKYIAETTRQGVFPIGEKSPLALLIASEESEVRHLQECARVWVL